MVEEVVVVLFFFFFLLISLVEDFEVEFALRSKCELGDVTEMSVL